MVFNMKTYLDMGFINQIISGNRQDSRCLPVHINYTMFILYFYRVELCSCCDLLYFILHTFHVSTLIAPLLYSYVLSFYGALFLGYILLYLTFSMLHSSKEERYNLKYCTTHSTVEIIYIYMDFLSPQYFHYVIFNGCKIFKAQ